jgi:hypothetical protein
MRQRCGQDEGKHLRDRVSPPRTTPGTQPDHWGNCPSALSADLDNLASRGPLRGTRPGGLRKVEANTHCQNDPAAPKPRLPRRTVDCSTQSSMRPGAGGGIFDPARQNANGGLANCEFPGLTAQLSVVESFRTPVINTRRVDSRSKSGFPRRSGSI